MKIIKTILATALLASATSTLVYANTSEQQLQQGITAAKKGDYRTALELWKPLAEQGNAEAQFRLYHMYRYSMATGKDLNLAAYWLKKSAGQGYLPAAFILAIEYSSSKEFGLPAFAGNEEQALYWFERVINKAQNDSPRTLIHSLTFAANMYFNGEGTEVNKRKAIDYWEKAAKLGGKDAYWELSQIYLGDSVEQNEIKGKEYRLKAAELGHSEARYALGKEAYDRFDYDEAFKWLAKVANEKYPSLEAIYYLAELYGEGRGTEKDLSQAFKWYEKAAERGHMEAQYELGNIYYHGRGVQKDKQQAAKWYEKAAEQGQVAAQYGLGGMYYNGDGVERNNEQAKIWLVKACKNRVLQACDLLKALK